MGEPAASRFPRLCRDGGERGDTPWRGSGDPPVRQARARRPHRHCRRRSRPGARGQRGHANLRRGGRCQPGRFDRASPMRRRRSPTRSRRGSSGSTRSRCCLGATYTLEVRLPDHDRDDLKPQIQAQCRQSRPCRRQDARAERGGLVQYHHGQGGGVRPLCRQRRYRLVHSDRSLHQCDGRRGHDRVRLAPRHQHPVAGAVRR